MLSSGDVVDIDLGAPEGNEAGLRRPAIVVTAQRVLDEGPSVVLVVPLTSTLRGYDAEVVVEPDADNGLDGPSAAQCQHLRAVSAGRILAGRGNVGATALAQVRDTVALLLDLPT
jgi:mRNA interferase MazF